VLLGRFPPGPAPVLARSANDASSEARAYASPEALRDTSSVAAHDGWHPRRPGAARRQRTVADV